MKKEIDCQVFADQLDALLEESLPEEGVRHLRLHADVCADCAMHLKVHEHLTLPSLEELEEAVPSDLLASMWPRVTESVAGLAPSKIPRKTRPGKASWLVPTLAAASLTLVFSTGFLLSELRRAESRGMRLAQQIIQLEEGMAAGNRQTEAAERTSNLGGRSTLILALAREDRMSVAGLQDRLRKLPGNTTLLEASQVAALLENTPPWTPAVWREALEAMGGEGISVQDLLGFLESSPLGSDVTIPTSQLIELLG